MLSSDVVIEYCGQEYRLPVLLVGSARSKLTDRRLSDELEEAMEGLRPVVVLEGAGAEAFHVAAHKISVSLERGTLDWQRLLAQLDASAPKGRSTYGSQILGKLQRPDPNGPAVPAARPAGSTPRPVYSRRRAAPADCRKGTTRRSRGRRVGVLEEPAPVGEHDRLHAVAQIELLEDVRDVRLHGRLADEELARRSRRSRGRGR